MLRLAFQGLRGRKGPFAGAFVALAVAAALVMACGTLLQAGLQSDPPVERYAAAPIVVSGSQKAVIGAGTENEDSVALFERARVDTSLAPRLAAIPGVRAAVPDTSTAAELRTRAGVVEGPTGHPTSVHTWASTAITPYSLRSGRKPGSADELAIDAGLAERGSVHLGQRVRLASNGPARTMTVVGVVGTSVRVDRQGAMFVTAGESQRLAGLPGRADSIAILPEHEADEAALAKRVGDVTGPHLRVATGADRGEVEHVETIEAKEAVISIGATFGGLALIIAMFVVSSTLGLSVMQREREVALLRAVAATPKQVRRMILWEALVIGLIASAVGLLPGVALASWLGGALSDHGVAPEDMEVATGVVPVIAAIGSSVLTAVISVAAAGRRAARVAPTQALQESSVEPRLIGPVRLLGGLISGAGALALLGIIAMSHDAMTASDAAAGVSLALVVAVAFLGPLVARVASWFAALIAGRGRVTGFLAASNVRASSRRFASAMTPLVLTVTLSCTMLFQASTRDHATTKQGGERVTADLVLGSDGVGVPRSAVSEARRIPGVESVTGEAPTTLGPGLGSAYKGAQAEVLDPHGLDRVLDLDVREGSIAHMRDDSIAVSRVRADLGHLTVGERASMKLGDGTPRRARVVAIYERGLGFGEAIVPTAMAAGHRTSPMLNSALVHLRPGAHADRVAARLSSLARTYPGLTVGDRHDLAVHVDADRAANDWLFKVLVMIVFAFTAIAVVNTLMMIGLHRSRELGLLRLVGATSRQVRSMARWEAGLIVALGLGLGAGISLVTLMPLSNILTGSLIPYAPLGLLALVLGSAAVVGFAGSELSTRLAMRTRPVDAIGVRD